MQLLERLAMRCAFAGVVLFFVALLGVNAQAAAPAADRAPQMAADADMASGQMPAMDDCMPCVYCNTGPASTVQGFSGEPKEQAAAPWTALAPRAPSLGRSFKFARRQPSPVPVRIAYCRWSN